MTNRESTLFKAYVKIFFSEIMQTSGHYPTLKSRLRENFNRFELEDLSELFATLCCGMLEDPSILGAGDSDDQDENSEDHPQQSGEEICATISDEAPAAGDEGSGCDDDFDSAEPA